MQQTAFTAAPPPPVIPTLREARPEVDRSTTWSKEWQETWLYKCLRVAASLRVTVALFSLSLFIVLWGTFAQVDFGINTVLEKYFRAWLAWVPLKFVLCWPRADALAYPWTQWTVPFPGGWTLGALLMTNLTAAHIVRFKTHWTQLGIWLIHIGIAIMMIGEFFTGMYAVEGEIAIVEGSTSNFRQHYHHPELAFVKVKNAKEDDVVVADGAFLRKKGVVSDPKHKFPCEIEIVEYMPNSKLVDLEPKEKSKATHGVGRSVKAVELPEGTGVDSEQRIDTPAAYVTLRKEGKDLGTYLLWHDPASSTGANQEWVHIDGDDYQVSLRFMRTYCDFEIALKKFEMTFYPGTKNPSGYRSEVELYENGKRVREQAIYMNNPMLYKGEKFFQAGWIPDPMTGKGIGTRLQVVRNPAVWFPYVSCLLVGVGMLFHFLLNLSRFIKRSGAYA